MTDTRGGVGWTFLLMRAARAATFDHLLKFVGNMLVDLPTAWQRANVDQKQRVKIPCFRTAYNTALKKEF